MITLVDTVGNTVEVGEPWRVQEYGNAVIRSEISAPDGSYSLSAEHLRAWAAALVEMAEKIEAMEGCNASK